MKLSFLAYVVDVAVMWVRSTSVWNVYLFYLNLTKKNKHRRCYDIGLFTKKNQHFSLHPNTHSLYTKKWLFLYLASLDFTAFQRPSSLFNLKNYCVKNYYYTRRWIILSSYRYINLISKTFLSFLLHFYLAATLFISFTFRHPFQCI